MVQKKKINKISNYDIRLCSIRLCNIDDEVSHVEAVNNNNKKSHEIVTGKKAQLVA